MTHPSKTLDIVGVCQGALIEFDHGFAKRHDVKSF